MASVEAQFINANCSKNPPIHVVRAHPHPHPHPRIHTQHTHIHTIPTGSAGIDVLPADFASQARP